MPLASVKLTSWTAAQPFSRHVVARVEDRLPDRVPRRGNASARPGAVGEEIGGQAHRRLGEVDEVAARDRLVLDLLEHVVLLCRPLTCCRRQRRHERATCPRRPAPSADELRDHQAAAAPPPPVGVDGQPCARGRPRRRPRTRCRRRPGACRRSTVDRARGDHAAVRRSRRPRRRPQRWSDDAPAAPRSWVSARRRSGVVAAAARAGSERPRAETTPVTDPAAVGVADGDHGWPCSAGSGIARPLVSARSTARSSPADDVVLAHRTPASPLPASGTCPAWMPRVGRYVGGCGGSRARRRRGRSWTPRPRAAVAPSSAAVGGGVRGRPSCLLVEGHRELEARSARAGGRPHLVEHLVEDVDLDAGRRRRGARRRSARAAGLSGSSRRRVTAHVASARRRRLPRRKDIAASKRLGPARSLRPLAPADAGRSTTGPPDDPRGRAAVARSLRRSGDRADRFERSAADTKPA